MLQEAAGGRSLYRSIEEMEPQRRMKGLTTRMWFKPTRGGNRISKLKDHPAPVPPGRRHNINSNRSNGNKQWKVHLPKEGTQRATSQKVKVVESPVFIPYTRDSKLRRALQEADDTIGEVLGTPSVRFVERCGGQTLVGLLGSSNP